MERFDQPKPLQEQHHSHPHPADVTSAIVPCAAVGIDDRGDKISGVFHLLSCGHIVAVDERNKRCARNCQHAPAWAASHQAVRKVHEEGAQVVQSIFPPISTTQTFDTLYCEICHGIPFDRYRILTMTEEPSPLRRSLALTRPVLQSAFALDDTQVHALLCSPFFNPYSYGFDWRNVHHLLCGHEVYTASIRPCAYNCSGYQGCHGGTGSFSERDIDAIVCQECVARAELVYQRFVRHQAPAQDGVDSGYVTSWT